jgi:hypothetical protein
MKFGFSCRSLIDTVSITGIAAWWLEKGKPISSKQAARQIAKDILPDYLRLIGN